MVDSVCWIWMAATAILPGETGMKKASVDLVGFTVTPHVMEESMRYGKPPEPPVGARVQLFLGHNGGPEADHLTLDGQTRMRFGDKSPTELLEDREWSWHDTPVATPDERSTLPEGAMTVWTFNSRCAPFGPGARMPIEVGPEDAPWLSEIVSLDAPLCWISAVTFLGQETAFQPDRIVVHVANESKRPVDILSCRIWLPQDGGPPRVFMQQPPFQHLDPFNGNATVPPKDRGGFTVHTDPLPLTYAVIEVSLRVGKKDPISIWAHLRIKTERFDISGGWVNGNHNEVTREAFLKTLRRIHVNTAHLGITAGYSDTELYEEYPLKYFNACRPIETYDTDSMLPKIHAVEFLGEPQYGGGRPVPPQEVWEKLHPYATSRLATTVTHSEERVWRDYAGLSDYPHYDAYRVTAPSADAWWRYERWGEDRIVWGAPLETIGDMCRSIRELNRPMPCAIWSQGPHAGWGIYGRRERTSPTPDEIRLQAYHAVSTRITSLYWFNLSLESLVKWRDTLDELGRVGRELRMLDEFLLEGDAFRHERLADKKGQLDWDVSSVVGPRAALLFALDLRYTPDPEEKVFVFGSPREAKWTFPLPTYLQGVSDVFRLDADGIQEVAWSKKNRALQIKDQASRVAIYLATPDTALRSSLEEKRQDLIAEEESLQFDPARNDHDFDALVAILEEK